VNLLEGNQKNKENILENKQKELENIVKNIVENIKLYLFFIKENKYKN
jgi:hypothetical protein